MRRRAASPRNATLERRASIRESRARTRDREYGLLHRRVRREARDAVRARRDVENGAECDRRPVRARERERARERASAVDRDAADDHHPSRAWGRRTGV